MIDPRNIVKVLFDTFDKSAVDDFRRFLTVNRHITKWHIAADFCLDDKDRPNDAFAFTVIPYDAYPHELTAEIRAALPTDLKKTKRLGPDASAFLKHPRRFHFGILPLNVGAIFRNDPNSDPRTVARDSLDITIRQLKKFGHSEESIKRFKELKQKAQARTFNLKLLANVYLLSYLLSFVTLALARETSVEMVGWFCDRDDMTTWCDGVIWDMGTTSLHGLAEHLGINIPSGLPVIAVPTPDAEKDAMWYDEYIRLPDYIAGILSAWNFQSNLLPDSSDKYLEFAQEVVADAKNMAVLKLVHGEILQCTRIVFHKGEIDSGYLPSDGSMGCDTEAV